MDPMTATTTTIRVDRETHARLLELSRVSGRPLIETVKSAAEALERQAFVTRVRAEFEAMSDEEMASYRVEIDSVTVSDGLDR